MASYWAKVLLSPVAPFIDAEIVQVDIIGVPNGKELLLRLPSHAKAGAVLEDVFPNVEQAYSRLQEKVKAVKSNIDAAFEAVKAGINRKAA